MIQLPADMIDSLAAAESVLVLTGAGVSAESGIPTFRDARHGLWARFQPQDLASADGFLRDPETVWQWYQWRRQLVRDAKPNPAHTALKDMQRLYADFTLVTQNVDGLHQRAGSGDVIELHGNILRNKCSVTGRPIDDPAIDQDQPPPSPHHPRGLYRPDVVWFGEALHATILTRSCQAAEQCDICLSIGTSAEVEPAASIPRLAQENGARLIEINPQTTALSRHADWSLRDTAATLMPTLVERIASSKGRPLMR